MSTTVAILGATTRPAASSLQRAGHQVVAADLFADADHTEICPVTQVQNYPDDFTLWLKNTPCDGWLYTGALENYPNLIDHLATLRTLWGNAGPVLRRVRNPLVLQEAIRGADLPFPETITSTTPTPLAGNWLYKTGRGGGGCGVQTAVELLNDAAKPHGYWQDRIAGTSGSAVYLGRRGEGTLLGITEQLVGVDWLHADRFAYCGSLFPWALPTTARGQLERLGRLLCEEFQLQGLFGVDFNFDDTDVWPVEVNPRPTAAVEVLERATGCSLLREHAQVFTTEQTRIEESNSAIGVQAKAILFSTHDLSITSQITEEMLHAAHRGELADVPRANQTIPIGAPICTLFAQADERHDAEAQLRQKVARWEAVFYGDQSSP